MMKHKRTKDTGTVRALATGLLVATLSFFLFAILVTIILFLGDDPTSKSKIFSFGALLISGAVSGFINARLAGDGGAVIALLSALAFILVMFLVGTVSVGLPSLASVINYALYICISAVSAYFAIQKPKRRHR